MDYQQLRAQAKDGDVFLVEGKAAISRFIRCCTGESVSHAAMLVWIEKGLYVAEYYEGPQGPFILSPASLWFEKYPAETVLYGVAPDCVRGNPSVLQMVTTYRDSPKKPDYGWYEFPKIWLAQWTGKTCKQTGLVCSTYVMKVWESCKYIFKETPDPGDYIRLCQMTFPIER
jgi:hypothetical protein